MTFQQYKMLRAAAIFRHKMTARIVTRCRKETNRELCLLRWAALEDLRNYLAGGRPGFTLSTRLIFDPAVLVLVDRACQAAWRKKKQ